MIRVTDRLLKVYPNLGADLQTQIEDVLLSRTQSALALLQLIDQGQYEAGTDRR